jgi:hypothetical protein
LPNDQGVVPRARTIRLEGYVRGDAVVGAPKIAQVAVRSAHGRYVGPAVASDGLVKAGQDAIGTTSAALLDELHTGSLSFT